MSELELFVCLYFGFGSLISMIFYLKLVRRGLDVSEQSNRLTLMLILSLMTIFWVVMPYYYLFFFVGNQIAKGLGDIDEQD